ncbi:MULTISPECIES: hypothetical protein [unclassified Microcoleus]|uniref:hypothetical protein n=1 Tax=unclassified Microcoleus TaxID=2642155 RepID=UPI002FD06EA2
MTYLKRLAEIRKQIEFLKTEVQAIEPDAIIEAFEILESKLSPNGKSLVHNDKNAKITLVLRTRYDDKNTSVVRLDEDIDREYEKLCRSNKTALKNNKAYIEELQEMIEAAEKKQKALLTSAYLERLWKQRAIALNNTEHKVPSLSVYLK